MLAALSCPAWAAGVGGGLLVGWRGEGGVSWGAVVGLGPSWLIKQVPLPAACEDPRADPVLRAGLGDAGGPCAH